MTTGDQESCLYWERVRMFEYGVFIAAGADQVAVSE
jgi:hypothetical protein